MRAEEQEVWSRMEAIKRCGVEIARKFSLCLSQLEDLGLLKARPIDEDKALIEAGLESWATSAHFQATYGIDHEAYRLFYRAAENQIRGTKESRQKLAAAEQEYHQSHWLDNVDDLRASDLESARAL